MTTHAHDVITSSLDPLWRTPERLFEALDAEFDFCVDAAATAEDTKCQLWFGPGSPRGIDDALAVAWAEHTDGPIFVNPPFSRKLKMPLDPWMRSAAVAAAQGVTVVAIIPHAPQTVRWRTFVEGQITDRLTARTYRAAEVRLFARRVRFDPSADYIAEARGNASGANGNTAVVVWRPMSGFIEPWTPHYRYWSY